MENNIPEIIIGWIMSVIALVGGVVMRDRAVLTKITDGDTSTRKEVSEVVRELSRQHDEHVAALYERINKTRDEFVRRDDLDGHLSRIEKNIVGMRDELRENNHRMDEFMKIVLTNQQRGHK